MAAPTTRTLSVWSTADRACRLSVEVARLGGGAYGRVTLHRVQDRLRVPFEQIAYKTFRESASDAIREGEISILDFLSSTPHPNVGSAIAVIIADDRWQGFVMPVYDMTLETLFQAQQGIFPELRVGRMAVQMLAGLAFLHDHRIMHRDIKADNVLLEITTESPMRCVLSDFGWSRHTHLLRYKFNIITMLLMLLRRPITRPTRPNCTRTNQPNRS